MFWVDFQMRSIKIEDIDFSRRKSYVKWTKSEFKSITKLTKKKILKVSEKDIHPQKSQEKSNNSEFQGCEPISTFSEESRLFVIGGKKQLQF